MHSTSKLANSALVASLNLVLAIAAFLSFLFPRFSDWGFGLIPITLLVLIFSAVLVLRDLWKSGTRLRAVFSVFLSLPVVALYMFLSAWEGPLYVALTAKTPPRFRIQGPAGFHGLAIYSPEHENAEWMSDDIGMLWRIQWSNPQKFPPMKIEFSYPELPGGFEQKIALPGPTSPPTLDRNVTYTLVVEPGMGMPEYFSLHGGQLIQYNPARKACWGNRPVSGRTDAIVRVDCASRQSLAMSQRALDRLKAYEEGRIPFF